MEVQILNAALVGATESSTTMHAHLAKQLLGVGAAADTWAPSGLSALMIASSLNKVDLMATLLHGGQSAAQDASKGEAFVGADIHLADAHGRTALMHAAASDHVEAVEVLVENGAQVWYSLSVCSDVSSILVSLLSVRSNHSSCLALADTTWQEYSLQVDVCDVANKSALDHCPPDGRCLPFLTKHVHHMEEHAKSIAQQLLEEECKFVAGHVDDVQNMNKGPNNHSTLLQVGHFISNPGCHARNMLSL